ncbi:MAG: hypothetical protein HKN09_09185 [Saprospiraceae bacterium]|nr:hypothetical protein [Saprospiraceae bacterium]
MISRILNIIYKDWVVERRGSNAFLASILYLTAIVFVLYKVMGDVSAPVRVALFWIIILFTGINLIAQSFSHASLKRKIIHYQLYKPLEYVFAKLIVNWLKLFLMGGVLLLLQLMLTDTLVKDMNLFMQTFGLASIGIVAVLTFVASISIYSNNQNGLVTILALPLLVPILLLSMRLSLIAERMFVDSATDNYLLLLLGINLLLIALITILFPIVWKS